MELNRIRRGPRGPTRSSCVSSAIKATPKSPGYCEMQLASTPRTAWLRLIPEIAAQPEPGLRLLQADQLGSRKYVQHVATQRRHVPQLSAGRELQALRDGGVVGQHRWVRGHGSHLGESAQPQP